MSAIDDSTVVTAAEVGVSGLLRRGEATPDVLVRTIQKVASRRRCDPVRTSSVTC